MGRPKLAPLAQRLKANEPLITRLKELRSSHGWSQADLAKKLEVHRSYISQLETMRVPISLRRLRRIAELYDVHPQSLFALLGVQEFDWVRTFRDDKSHGKDYLSTAAAKERDELSLYLEFIRWRNSTKRLKAQR